MEGAQVTSFESFDSHFVHIAYFTMYTTVCIFVLTRKLALTMRMATGFLLALSGGCLRLSICYDNVMIVDIATGGDL